ncbi:4659_t:CDS:2, partial [Dentiscutata heterogama]
SKLTTLTILTTSLQSTILAQATKLNDSVANSLAKKRKIADQVANTETPNPPIKTTKNLIATNNMTTTNKSLGSRKELLVGSTVFELIFNENYLLAKLDSNIVDTWYQKLLKKTSNKKDTCTSSANLQVESLDLMDVDDLYENLLDSNSESHLSDNNIEDNNSNENYVTSF